MITSAALIDLHERVHACLVGLLEHCAGFAEEDLSRTFEGFGAGSIRMQLHHVIGAEAYWIGVLEGKMLTEERAADHASLGALRAFRERVAGVTGAYLAGASDDDLNAPRTVTTWGDKETVVVPAYVLLRTQTHAFQHKGQISALARLLDRPVPDGLDLPLA